MFEGVMSVTFTVNPVPVLGEIAVVASPVSTL